MNKSQRRSLRYLTRLGIIGVIALSIFKSAKLGRNSKSGTANRLPPGSLGLPVIGETLSYAKNPHLFFETRFKKYGPVFKTRILRDNVVCFVGPEAFSFFVNQPSFDREGANPRHVQRLFYGQSLPLVDGDKHREIREPALQAFSQQVMGVYVPMIERVTLGYLEQWEQAVNFAWLLEYKKMSASICDALFNGAKSGEDSSHLGQVLDTFIAGVTALPINLPWTKLGRAMKSRDELLTYIDNAISMHRQRPYEDLLAELLKAASKDESHLSMEQLRAVLVHMYFAAYGNTFRVLTLFCKSLAQNSEVMERARTEILQHAPEGPLDLETLRRLTYLDQVTKEVRRHNRIFASTFFDRVTEPFEFQGYHVPEGWKAIGGIYTTMQDSRVFTNPDRFDPDRFGPDREEDRRQENSYIPQGGGPMEGHRCPSEDFTTVLMKIVGVLLLRNYSWELPPQNLELDNESSPLPRDGLKVKFTRRTPTSSPQSV